MKTIRNLTYIFLFFPFLVFAQDGERGSIAKTATTSKSEVKRAFIVGVSDYFSESLKLNYAESDAALFKDYLLKVEQLPEDHITYLVNKDAIALNIGRALRKLVNDTNEGETVYIYFAGHGDVVGVDFYMIPKNGWL